MKGTIGTNARQYVPHLNRNCEHADFFIRYYQPDTGLARLPRDYPTFATAAFDARAVTRTITPDHRQPLFVGVGCELGGSVMYATGEVWRSMLARAEKGEDIPPLLLKAVELHLNTGKTTYYIL